jgi:hypothetical protein
MKALMMSSKQNVIKKFEPVTLCNGTFGNLGITRVSLFFLVVSKKKAHQRVPQLESSFKPLPSAIISKSEIIYALPPAIPAPAPSSVVQPRIQPVTTQPPPPPHVTIVQPSLAPVALQITMTPQAPALSSKPQPPQPPPPPPPPLLNKTLPSQTKEPQVTNSKNVDLWPVSKMAQCKVLFLGFTLCASASKFYLSCC